MYCHGLNQLIQQKNETGPIRISLGLGQFGLSPFPLKSKQAKRVSLGLNNYIPQQLMQHVSTGFDFVDNLF